MLANGQKECRKIYEKLRKEKLRRERKNWLGK